MCGPHFTNSCDIDKVRVIASMMQCRQHAPVLWLRRASWWRSGARGSACHGYHTIVDHNTSERRLVRRHHFTNSRDIDKVRVIACMMQCD